MALRRGVRDARRGGAWLLLCALLPAVAAATGVSVTGPWARATAPGQTTASVYFEIRSDVDAALVGARSAVAQRVEMHVTRTEGGVTSMRAVEKIPLSAGRTVKLAPAGMHLMLVGIKHPLREGESIPLAVTVERAGHGRETIDLTVAVRSLTAAGHAH